MTTIKLTGNAAIAYAETNGRTLSKYTDPTEEARSGLSVSEAREIAREDEGLIYIEIDPSEMIASVAKIVGDDGTGDLGIIVREALTANHAVTVRDIVEIVREAREDAALEAAQA